MLNHVFLVYFTLILPINMSPDEIEERFHFMVESHLADLDLYEIGKDMKKIDINAN